jgi:Protein of unknown function (DUF2924)
MASGDTQAIEGEIDRIRSLGLEELRREWRRLNHGEPPRISRDLLILALGYRLQEIAHGGLGVRYAWTASLESAAWAHAMSFQFHEC